MAHTHTCSGLSSSRLEQKNGNLSQVEVDEMFGLVCHIGSKVSSNNAMPGRTVFLVKFFLDVGGNVLFNVVLFEGLHGRADSIFLHFFAHVNIFDDGFLLRLTHLVESVLVVVWTEIEKKIRYKNQEINQFGTIKFQVG